MLLIFIIFNIGIMVGMMIMSVLAESKISELYDKIERMRK